ncbi:hypothetical protein KP509_01G068100 [Ceratopteris richardii]|uniref:Uncharacterized protein n=1 Tax=Ceratopteris richardii TaxID=49495 RepID=A0A8T2VH69_CERRI|nr:hypothetical protein KP509_01G068100 [Ceratopteris richardii]
MHLSIMERYIWMRQRDRHKRDDLDHHRVLTKIHQIMWMIVMMRMRMRMIMMLLLMMMMIMMMMS